MQPLDITATSAEEARAKAAKTFGVEPERIKLTVIEEKKGLFGQGRVRVRAELEAAPEPEPQPVAPTPEPQPEVEAAAPAPERPRRRRTVATETEEAPVQAEAPAVEVAPVEPAPAEKRGRRRKPVEAEPAATEVAPSGEKPEKSEKPEEVEENPVIATEEDANTLVGLLQQVLTSGGLGATVQCSSLTGKYVNIELDGPDVRFLIGKRGEVLNAIQYLMNVVATRKLGTGVRVVIDGDSYRQKREQVLSNYAIGIAEQVRERGEEAVLDPLPAFERRIIHKALLEVEGVTTYSEGEEPNRCVVIAPAQ